MLYNILKKKLRINYKKKMQELKEEEGSEAK